jgi:hypothetical protein
MANQQDFNSTVKGCWDEMHPTSGLSDAMQELVREAFRDPIFKAWPEAKDDDFRAEGTLEGQSTIRVGVTELPGGPAAIVMVGTLDKIPVPGESRAEWDIDYVRAYQFANVAIAKTEAVAFAREFSQAWKLSALSDGLVDDDMGFVTRSSRTATETNRIANSPK